jgi:hypothetical protein
MKLIPLLTILSGLLAGLAIGSLEADSHACSKLPRANTWTLEIVQMSIEGDDEIVLEDERARWQEATQLDFDTDDAKSAWIQEVWFDTPEGSTNHTVHFDLIDDEVGK